MKVGTGNGKGNGGMLKTNSIMVNNLQRRNTLKDPNKVFIGGLNNNTTKADLRELCKNYGDVVHVKLVMNYYTKPNCTKKSKGYAFVRYCDPIGAAAALSSMTGTMLDGNALVCDSVEEKENVKKKKGKKASAGQVDEPVFDMEAALAYPCDDISDNAISIGKSIGEAPAATLEDSEELEDPVLAEARRMARGLKTR